MAYSQELADRVREQLGSTKRVTEREMFGGISFMVAGNMCCGVLDDDLVVRIDPTLHHDALTRPNVRALEFGGRSSKGMVRVGPASVADDDEFSLWMRLGIAHATSLPPKQAKRAVGARTRPAPAAKKKKSPARKKSTAVKKKRKASAKKKVPAAKKTSARTKATAGKKAKKKATPAKRIKKSTRKTTKTQKGRKSRR